MARPLRIQFPGAVSRYIARNPVRAGLVAKPAQWRWSSYRITIGSFPPPSFLTTAWVLRQFHSKSRAEAVRLFRKFVETDQAEGGTADESLKGRPILGNEEFVSRFRDELRAVASELEHSRRERFAARPSLAELLPAFENRNERNAAIRRACLDHGYAMVEVAAYLGLHYVTIHRAIKHRM